MSDDVVEYGVDLDHSVWIPVPLEFPWNGYADVDQWSTDLAVSLLEGFETSNEVRAALALTARSIADTAGPFPGAVERFWHFPLDGGTQRVVHLTIEEYADTGESAWRAVATAGIGGYVQGLDPLDDTEFDEAVRSVVVAQDADDETSAPVFVVRFQGFRAGMVFIVEVVDTDTAVVEALLDPAEALFRSIRLRQTDSRD